MATKKSRPRRQYGLADDGRKIVSVTEVLGNLGKPGLMWWAAEEAAKACASFLREGLSDEEAIERARKSFNKTKDRAAEAGTIAHGMMERFLLGEDAEAGVDAFGDAGTLEKARAAFARFAAWWPASGYTLHLVEEQLVDKVRGYGGTVDMVLRDASGTLVVADLKTGKGVYSETVFQLAGYRQLLRDVSGLVIERGLVVHCPVEGELGLHEVESDALAAGERVFNALLIVEKTKDAARYKGEAA